MRYICHHDVLGFDVAMGDVVLVKVVDTFGYLFYLLGYLVLFEGFIPFKQRK